MPDLNPSQTEQNDTGRFQNVVRHGAEKAGEKAKEAAQSLTHGIEQQPVKASSPPRLSPEHWRRSHRQGDRHMGTTTSATATNAAAASATTASAPATSATIASTTMCVL